MPSSSRKSPVSLLEHLKAEKQQGPLSAADIAAEVKASLKPARDVVLIPLTLIDLGRLNPRKGFDEKELEALADTIGTTGIVHPLLVRSNPDDPRRFETIAGARRLQAAHIVWGRGDPDERARVAELPCMIKEFTDTQAFISAIAENASRTDLTLAEMIDAVRRLRDETNWSGSEIARRIGRHRAYVSELLAVADNGDLSRLVGEEVIAPKTAVVIAHMPDELKQAAIERAWRGQLKTKADAERLRLQDRLRHRQSGSRGAEGAAVPAPSADASSGEAAGQCSPENIGSQANIGAATTVPVQRSPENKAEAHLAQETDARPAPAPPEATATAGPAGLEGNEALSRDAHALHLAEAMLVAVGAFLAYVRDAPRLPDDDPAMVLFQRARKDLAYFEAMRHVSP